MNNPKVSVLVPSLNVAKYIEQCMESIVNQTLRDIEIICIDAGSTDGTLEILERFAKSDSRIHLINSDRKSYGYQMNLGLAMASGEYIGIIETDDFAERSMFEDLYSLAIKQGADLVMSSYYAYSSATNKNSKVNRLPFSLKKEKLIPHESKDKAILLDPAIWTNIYSRKMIKDYGIAFVESPGASYQDTAFSIKAIIAANKIAVTYKAYYHYRTDNENSSVKSSGKVFCVCDELADVEQFVRGSEFDALPLWALIWRKKFNTYEWNISRLEKPAALEFVDRMKKEFTNDVPEHVLDASIFDEIKTDIDMLIHDSKKYLLTRPFIDFEEFSKGEDEFTVLAAENYILKRENEELKNKCKGAIVSTVIKLDSNARYVYRKVTR